MLCLRTGELCRVQASDFVKPEKAGPILLTLPDTKLGIRRGDLTESVVLTDPVLIHYLLVLLPRILLVSACGQRILNLFEHIFESCARTLPPLDWRPYSLRRGGATAHFLQFGSLDKTAVRGRWQSTRTARLYIRCRGARIHCVHAGSRTSHTVFGNKCGQCPGALSVNQH